MEFYGVEGGYAYTECYKTAFGINYELLKELAKKNKLNPTLEESLMWDLLRTEFKAFKFRRQHIIGDYIVDFVCFKRNLVIEIDGGYHTEDEQIDKDALRSEWLNRQGLQVVRFTNEEVLFQKETVISELNKLLNV